MTDILVKREKKHADYKKYIDYYKNYHKILNSNKERYKCECNHTTATTCNMYKHFKTNKHKNDKIIKFDDTLKNIGHEYENKN